MRGIATRDCFDGTRIGDYVLGRELPANQGERAFEARHVLLPRSARIVVPDPAVAGSAERLMRQACILEAVQHHGVPRMHECGVLGVQRRPWVAMELVEGATLFERMADLSLSMLDVITLLRDVSEILHHAHNRGIIHANLSARAVVYRQDDTLCLVDWGHARLHDSPGSRQSQDRIYRAPEQLQGDPVDGKTDIYALGVLAHQAMSRGLSMFGAGKCNAETASELQALIDRMLDDDPTERPTAADVRTEAIGLVELFFLPDLDIPDLESDALPDVVEPASINVVELDMLDLVELEDMVDVPSPPPAMPNRKIAWTPRYGYEVPVLPAGTVPPGSLGSVLQRRRRV